MDRDECPKCGEYGFGVIVVRNAESEKCINEGIPKCWKCGYTLEPKSEMTIDEKLDSIQESINKIFTILKGKGDV